jgi:acid phosphatase type 7
MKMKTIGMSAWTPLLCVALWASAPAHAQVGPRYQAGLDPPRIIAGPCLQSAGQDSMAVVWVTDKNSTATVEYGTTDTLDHKAVAMHDGLIDANSRLHKVKLTGLTPGTEYRYRVCSTEIVKFGPYSVTFGTNGASAPATFKTLSAKADKLSIAVMNDLHQNAQTLQALCALAKVKPVDLVFLNGDSLDYLESEEQVVGHLLQAVTEQFATTTPLMYVRGNHETRGRFARSLRDYIATPSGKYYYSFDAGPVHFVVLDTGEDKEDSHAAYSGLNDFAGYRDEEKQWLAQEIRSEAFGKAPFRVVFMHMPPFSSRGTRSGGTKDCFEKFAPLLNGARVDLLITAHTHRYAYLEPQPAEHDYPMVNGGGPSKDRATLIRLDVERERMQLTVTRGDGEVLKQCDYPAKSPLRPPAQ